MKIQVASDLHLEILSRRFPGYRVIEPAGADVLVLAGDIHQLDQAVAAFADWPVPVILLNGNHEFYGSTPAFCVPKLLQAAERTDRVQYFENRVWIYRDVRFIGCCLWTDYALYGEPEAAMAEAEHILMDHRRIRMEDDVPFLPAHARALHHASVAWLRTELAKPHLGKTIVCTHHGPSARSTHPDFANNALNPCFMSNLDELFEHADLWIHGHVHNSFNYQVGRCRVVVNPRGYALNLRQAAETGDIRWENPYFDPGLVIAV